MFAVTVLFDIRPGDLGAFLPLMLENARVSRETEAACQQFDVCVEGEQVFLYEIYDDRAAFEAHLSTAHFLSFDAAVTEMVVRKEVRCFEQVMR